MNPDGDRPIEYVLTGFNQEHNIRRFAFDGIDGDRTRTKFTVAVDVSLIRKYAISIQELPLLCRHLLEVQAAATPNRTITFTEADMIGHADRRAAAELAAEQRKIHRKFPTNRAGETWRRSSPLSRKPD